jgi:hypothetical protein
MAVPERGIELVNQAEKGNQEPNGGAIMTGDGNHVFWGVQTGAPNSSSAYSQFEAVRTMGIPQWWENHSVLPPVEQLEPNTTYDSLLSVAADGSRAVLRSHHGDGAQGTVRVEPDGSIVNLYTSPPDHIPGCQCMSASMSKDGSRVFLELTRNFADYKPTNPGQTLDPDHPQGTSQIYEIGSGTADLLSRMPDGTVPNCSPGFPYGPFYSYAGIDASGSRAVFRAYGSDCSGPQRLYLRDLETDTTTAIGGAPLSGEESGDTFVRISGDGSELVYVTANRLLPDDQNRLPDIYRWSDADGIECLTCVVPKADVYGSSAQDPGVAVSDDFSHIYFTSTRKLVADEGVRGKANVYVWNDGEIRYVTQLSELRPFPTRSFESDLTPDGKVVVFQTGIQGATTDEADGSPQFLRYDDRDGSVECVTCAGPGVVDRHSIGADRPAGVGIDDLGMLSDDGETVAFKTMTPLLRRDINNGYDIYVWHNGSRELVTSGADKWPSDKLSFKAMTGDAGTILFGASARLTGYETDAVGQLYVSRIGSDNPGPATPPAVCVEDSCQGPLVTPPGVLPAGSAEFSGPGNEKPGKGRKHRRTCKRGQKAVRVKGKTRCVRKKGAGAKGANGKRRAGK